jgi:Cupin domain.
MGMIETRITNEKPPVVYDLDDFRHGLGNWPNDARVAVTPHHKVSLWTIQAGKTVPLHTHSDSECVIIVMAGQGEYMWGNRTVDMKKVC